MKTIIINPTPNREVLIISGEVSLTLAAGTTETRVSIPHGYNGTPFSETAVSYDGGVTFYPSAKEVIKETLLTDVFGYTDETNYYANIIISIDFLSTVDITVLVGYRVFALEKQ